MPNPTDAASASTRTGLALTLPMIRPHSQVSTVAAAILNALIYQAAKMQEPEQRGW